MRVRHLLGLALASGGCAFRTPTPDVPAVIGGDADAPVDLEVASVSVGSTVATIDPTTKADVVRETTRILHDAAAKASSGGARAVVRVDVDLLGHRDFASESMRRDGLAAFGWLAMWPAGIKYEAQSLTVTLTIERDGRVFRGLGAADVEGSIYAPARRRALAAAIDAALAEAAES